ncbi:uncharacterized protein [Ptychodera flava]|uniref:uncharacterized protein n=1 Tax=Ptychodera flava TaxID=63121 RepID=UPI003969D4C7
MTVLWWIRNRCRKFKPFVANRVGEVQTSTNPEQWRYVPTKENAADLVTRGVTAVDLADKDLWWKGPGFLAKSTSDWPKNPITKGNEVTDIEMKRESSNRQVTFISKKDPRISHCSILRECEQQVQTAMVTTQTESTSHCLNPVRFSSWTTLKRIQAWVCRFLDNFCKLPKEERTKGELLPEEIEEAEIMIIKTMQAESFPEEYSALVGKKELPKKSKLLGLRPRLDEDGLMRCDGRLRYADYLPYDVRYLVILPQRNWVTKQIVKHYHEQGKHVAWTNHTLSALSTRFWIIAGRGKIR